MTTSAVVYTFFFIHIGVILVATAYYTLGAALIPSMTERGRIRFGRRWWMPTLIGLVVSTPWVAASLILLNLDSAQFQFTGAGLGCLWVLAGLLGGAGIAQHVGVSRGGESTDKISWVQTFRGGLFIGLTWILPLVGWLIVLPLTLAAGVGCLVMGFFPLREQVSPAVISES